VFEVPTGTRAFDWTVPREWNIRDAYVKDPSGERVIDFKKSNLHVLNYSVPVNARMPLSELREHLFTLPDHPDWIPYKTSYYKENWGFCLSRNALASLRDVVYEVRIDSSLEDGHLTYGECFLPGRSADEVLLSCHVCHPSLCNDNLSGIALCAALAGSLAGSTHRYSYRILFVPGTIGAIVWLSRNEERAMRIRHGLVVACVGDPGPMHYKKSRRGDAEIDRAVVHALEHSGAPYTVSDFSPYGYDERQYCSPGFDLAVGALSRTPHGRFEQYHSSADDLEFVTADALAGSFGAYRSALGLLEKNATYVNQNPKCEPQLGRRGLYRDLGGHAESKTSELAMLWVLNLSDGTNSLLDIAERSGLPFETIETAAERLVTADLLKERL
jgi:aminopeptidase-like protein